MCGTKPYASAITHLSSLSRLKLWPACLKFIQNDVEFAQQKDGLMKRRFIDEQIIQMIKEQEAGERTADVCRRYGISEVTFY